MCLNTKKPFLQKEDGILKAEEETQTWEEQMEAIKARVLTYRVGYPVRCVLGGYFGPYLYGTVTKVNETHSIIKPMDKNGKIVAQPTLCSGLEHISWTEYCAAQNGWFFKDS